MILDVDPFSEGKHQPKLVFKKQIPDLVERAKQWDQVICRSMHEVAVSLWPSKRVLGLIPVCDFRLRKRAGEDRVVWWVEHDLFPYDLYLCAAYAVELGIDQLGELVLAVQNGNGIEPILKRNPTSIQYALCEAMHQPPAIVPRWLGEALDL